MNANDVQKHLDRIKMQKQQMDANRILITKYILMSLLIYSLLITLIFVTTDVFNPQVSNKCKTKLEKPISDLQIINMEYKRIQKEIDTAINFYKNSVIDNSVDLLVDLEGFRSRPYKDASGYSIGYGHHSKILKNLPKHVTHTKAKLLLYKDVEKIYLKIKPLIHVSLTIEQMSAIVSFTYNIGTNGFRLSTLLKRINNKQYNDVPNQLQRFVYYTPHNKTEKQISNGLLNRRNIEISMWEGDYTT